MPTLFLKSPADGQKHVRSSLLIFLVWSSSVPLRAPRRSSRPKRRVARGPGTMAPIADLASQDFDVEIGTAAGDRGAGTSTFLNKRGIFEQIRIKGDPTKRKTLKSRHGRDRGSHEPGLRCSLYEGFIRLARD